VHAVTSTGKMIVTLETTSEHEIAARLSDINGLPGVVSAALVFHQFEPETPT
jgi:nitrate reductase NapD